MIEHYESDRNHVPHHVQYEEWHHVYQRAILEAALSDDVPDCAGNVAYCEYNKDGFHSSRLLEQVLAEVLVDLDDQIPGSDAQEKWDRDQNKGYEDVSDNQTPFGSVIAILKLFVETVDS